MDEIAKTKATLSATKLYPTDAHPNIHTQWDKNILLFW